MRSKRKISGVVIAVALGCAVFIGYQYFMANANRQALNEEDAQEYHETNTSGTALNEEGKQSLREVPEVRAYINFVNDSAANGNSMADDNFVLEAMVYLVDALGVLAQENIGTINPIEVENLRSQLAEYETTQSVAKSEYLKDAITTATGILQGMQRNNVALEEELEELRKDADAIDENTAAQEQSEDLAEYFEQAAVVLEEAERNI